MTALTYAVLQVGPVWQIVCDRRRIGHFATQDEASRLGAMLAHEAALSGHDVQVLVQGRFGELHGLQFRSQVDDEGNRPEPLDELNGLS